MLQNERGQTLVIVLLTISLISIFATVLVSQSLSGTKQVKQTEGHQKATDAAEMGIEQFYSALKEKYLKRNILIDPCPVLRSEANSLAKSKSIDSQTSYSISLDTDANKVCWYSSAEKKYKFSFKSTGSVSSVTNTISKQLTATFSINFENMFPPLPDGFVPCKNSGSPPCTPTGDDDDDYEDGLTYNKVYFPNGFYVARSDSITANSLYIEDKLDISGFNKTDELKINQDLFVNGATLINTHATVKISGSLYLNGDFDIRNHGDLIVNGNMYLYKDIMYMPNSFICVDGTLNKTTKSVMTITPLGNSTCAQKALEKNIKGIFAKWVNTIDAKSNAVINDNDLTVSY
ncbi:type II secretion system GspH family protein [Bacillus timonensis]|nr:type II secretion system GspH family protein [Bacillus timonensis]